MGPGLVGANILGGCSVQLGLAMSLVSLDWGWAGQHVPGQEVCHLSRPLSQCLVEMVVLFSALWYLVHGA